MMMQTPDRQAQGWLHRLTYACLTIQSPFPNSLAGKLFVEYVCNFVQKTCFIRNTVLLTCILKGFVTDITTEGIRDGHMVGHVFAHQCSPQGAHSTFNTLQDRSLGQVQVMGHKHVIFKGAFVTELLLADHTVIDCRAIGMHLQTKPYIKSHRSTVTVDSSKCT